MSALIDERVHGGEPRYGRSEPICWRDDGTCSYCGSLSVPEVVRLLRTPGTHFSGTDKTSYKCYVRATPDAVGKFYFRHLRACTDAELMEFDALSRKVFGLAWSRDGTGDVLCRFPRSDSFYGWQTWGDIGPDGEPVHHPEAPKPPEESWWTKP